MRRKAYGSLHSLKKPKVRQSWNKANLYNLSRLWIPTTEYASYFQQKWAAKSLTRGYHGEHIGEKKWNRLFSRSIPSVVPMDHKELAMSDGSDQAMGRGSGLEEPLEVAAKKGGKIRTPFMQMTFHPIERRLDTAIFRAMFASSVRQARMFCVQGHVKVNGKKMIYPGYTLNPGDMFSITPKWVLQATGAPKLYLGTEEHVQELSAKAQALLEEIKAQIAEAASAETAEEGSPSVEESHETEGDAEPDALLSDEQRANKKAMRDMRKKIQEMLDTGKDTLSNKQKQALRALRTEIPKIMGRKEFDALHLANLKQRFGEATLSKVAGDEETAAAPSPGPEATPTKDTRQGFKDFENATRTLTTLRLNTQYLLEQSKRYEISQAERDELRALYILSTQLLASQETTTPEFAAAVHAKVEKIVSALGLRTREVTKRMEAEFRPDEWNTHNPYDLPPDAGVTATTNGKGGSDEAEPDKDGDSTAAVTVPRSPIGPWRPRPYMSAFAFIPRYLEVNQNVCSAVYLRHPVTRPGLAEVPTPFPEGLNQLAFNWYLRRR